MDEWINKLWCIHIMISFNDEKNELFGHNKTCMNFQEALLLKRSNVNSLNTILYNSNSGNGKTIETVNKSVIAMGLEVKYKGIFRTVKLFCMIVQWWIYDIMHWSNPIELYSTKSES